MVMENNKKMLQAEEKENKSQSADSKQESETSNKTNSCVSKSMWLKLAGHAARELKEVFLGSNVTVLQDRKVKAQAEGASNSAETGQEFILKVGVFNAFMPTPPGEEAEGGDAQEPGKGASSRVITERAPPRIIIPGCKSIKVLKSYRIVLLGEAGAGKSSLGNNIFGEDVFKINPTPKRCGSSECQVESKSVHGRRIMLVDAPGFGDTDGPEPDLKGETLRGISECAPHAFLIVLRVEAFTEQKKAVIDKVCQLFSEGAFKYAAVVLTHADQLPEGMNIEEFVDHNKCLSDLIKICCGRYHVVDNRCGQDKVRNQLQILQLLSTIEKIVMENKWGCYTNKFFPAEKRETGNTSVRNLPQGETDSKASNSDCRNMWIKLSGPAGDIVAEAFFGPAAGVGQKVCKEKKGEKQDRKNPKEEEIKEPGQKEKTGSAGAGAGLAWLAWLVGAGLWLAGSVGAGLAWLGSVGAGLAWLAGSVGAGLAWLAGSVGAGLAWLAGSVGAGLAWLAGAGLAGSVGAGLVTTITTALKLVLGAAAAAAAGAVAWVLTIMIPKIQWIKEKFRQLYGLVNDLKQHSGVILLVVVFCLLMVLFFLAKVPFAGTILLSLGILAMFLLIVVLFLSI